VSSAKQEPPPTSSAEPASAPTPEPPPPPAAKRTVGQLATEAKDDRECEQRVKALQEKVKDIGPSFAMLQACVARDKFRNLALLFTSPWREAFETLAPDNQLDLVTHLLAVRGAMIETDVPKCLENRVPVYELASAFKEPKLYEGRYVIATGMITEQKQDQRGWTVAEIQETHRQTKDRIERVAHYKEYRKRGVGGAEIGPVQWRSYEGTSTEKVGSFDMRAETGRMLTAKIVSASLKPESNTEYVFLFRVDRVQADPTSEEDLAPRGGHADVRLVQFYRIGQIAPEVAPVR
jgi:hypothetical protein